MTVKIVLTLYYGSRKVSGLHKKKQGLAIQFSPGYQGARIRLEAEK